MSIVSKSPPSADSRPARGFRRFVARLRGVRRDTRGAAAIEMAITLPIMAALIAGVVEFGRYYWVQNAMQLALEETARWVMVSGTTSQSTVQTYMRNKLMAVPKTTVSVTVVVAASGSVNYATIDATHSFNSIFDGLVPGLFGKQIHTKVRVPVVT